MSDQGVEKSWRKLMTRISWCHFVWNWWIGCDKVSAGCAHCYAETYAKRVGRKVWGATADRPRTATWRRIQKFRRLAGDPEWRAFVGLNGQRPRVFVGSLMDWAEDRDEAQRAIVAEAWPIIREAQELDFLMLTKRPENIGGLLPDDWRDGYPNVWMMTSIESGLSIHRDRHTGQPVRERAEHLLRVPAAVHAISYEPAIGPLATQLYPYLQARPGLPSIGWVIYGGESGAGFRPEGTSDEPKAWARAMRDLCAASGVPFFHKQSSAFRNECGVELDGRVIHQFPASVAWGDR